MRLLYKILDHKDFNNLLTLVVFMLIQAVSVGVADLTLPGEFAFSSRGMEPNSGSVQNRRRQLLMGLNKVTVVIS
jgi:hypothetical protein